MLFATDEDILRCTEIVRDELFKRNMKLREDILSKITEDIMSISYSKGGDYSNEIVKAFAKGYFEKGLHKKLFVGKRENIEDT